MPVRSLFLCGAIAVAVAAWFISSVGDGNESSHPFRSEEAKRIYFEYYDERAKNVPGESRTISTSFGETHVRAGGPVGASPLVLLPGDSETLLSWEPQWIVLSSTYRTYAVDVVGDFGKSVYSRRTKNPDDYVMWLLELFDGLDIDKAHLIGFSYGGWIASRFALKHPEHLLSVALIAPASTVIAPGWELLVRAILQWTFPAQWIIKNYLSWYNADSPQQDVNDMIDELLLSNSCFKPRRFIVPTVLTDDEWQRLAELQTLFIVGENDVTYSASQATERLTQFNITTRLVPSAGHDLRTIQKDRVNHELLSFLKTVSV